MLNWELAFRPVVVLLACLPTLLSACAGPTVSSPVFDTPGSSARVGPSAASPPTDGIQFMVWGSGPQLQAYQELLAAYRQRHPDEQIDLVGVPGEADFQKRLAADVAAGTVADVVVESYTQVARLAARGLLVPIAPYMAGSRVLKPGDFSGEAFSPFVYERHLQCVPFSASGLVVYYNKNLLQQAALPFPRRNWTPDDFVTDARALTRDTDGDGHPDRYGVGIQPTLTNLMPFVWQRKGHLVDIEAWPTELALGSLAVLSATTWLVSLQSQYHVVPDSQAELAASSEQRFIDGTLAMVVDTPDSVPAFRQITAFDWDVAPLPAYNTGTSNVVIANGLCLTSASRNKAAAWQFIEFAGSPEGEALMARSGAIVPALTAVADSPAFQDPTAKPAHSQVFVEALAHALAMPKLENWSDIQAIADEELQQAFYGQKDIAQALDAATARSEEYFKIHTAH
jgi:multiple sugar transport system substrate-binding protein